MNRVNGSERSEDLGPSVGGGGHSPPSARGIGALAQMMRAGAIDAMASELASWGRPLAALVDGLETLAMVRGLRGTGDLPAFQWAPEGNELDFFQGHRFTGRPDNLRSLLRSPLQCGATLDLQNAGMASDIVSASPSESRCSGAAVSPESVMMDLILGAVISVNQATVDMRVSPLSLLLTH